MECGLCEAQNESYRLIVGNDLAFCVIPTQALKPGHVMVLPRRHVASLTDLIDTETRAIAHLADQVQQSLREAYTEPPVLFMNFGDHSTQSHIHWHILPSKGGLRALFSASEGLIERPERSVQWVEGVKDSLKIYMDKYVTRF